MLLLLIIMASLSNQETQHHVFLVMEYCNGGDLADYLSGKQIHFVIYIQNKTKFCFSCS